MSSTLVSIDRCLICGSKHLKFLLRYSAHHLVRCRKCSFIFSRRRPSSEELNHVYSAYSRGVTVPSQLTLLKYNGIVSQLSTLRKIDTVLDVGCGDGHFLSAFQRGIKTFGTEYNEAVANVAASRGITMLSGGLLPDVPEGINHFDLIVFTEVIEHILDPALVVNHFSSLLDEGGLLYITTPNFRSIESALLGPDWGMVAYPEHLCYYTPRTLHFLLRAAGFEKISLSTKNISFFRLAQFWLKRNASSSSSLDPEAISIAAQAAFHGNIFMRTAKTLVNMILNVTSTGSSLVAIYRKPSPK